MNEGQEKFFLMNKRGGNIFQHEQRPMKFFSSCRFSALEKCESNPHIRIVPTVASGRMKSRESPGLPRLSHFRVQAPGAEEKVYRKIFPPARAARKNFSSPLDDEEKVFHFVHTVVPIVDESGSVANRIFIYSEKAE